MSRRRVGGFEALTIAGFADAVGDLVDYFIGWPEQISLAANTVTVMLAFWVVHWACTRMQLPETPASSEGDLRPIESR